MRAMSGLVAMVVAGAAMVGGAGGRSAAWGQLAVVANDRHVVLEKGVITTVKNPPGDTVAVVDLGAAGGGVKVLAELEGVPNSVIGPPLSVAVSGDGSLALVTACMKIDPADLTKQTEDNRVSVIDLKANPPKVIATVEAGKGPAGVSINKAGTLALVANRGDGAYCVFLI